MVRDVVRMVEEELGGVEARAARREDRQSQRERDRQALNAKIQGTDVSSIQVIQPGAE